MCAEYDIQKSKIMPMTIIDKFFYLLQMAMGKVPTHSMNIAEAEWGQLYSLAIKQSLLGVIFEGVQKLSEVQPEQKPPLPLLYEWMGQCEMLKRQNQQLNQQGRELCHFFKREGIDSCILKGQGVACLYENPASRQPGDIDIWVNAFRDDVVSMMRAKGVGVTVVDYVNCHAAFFKDIEVEVHFRPTWFYNPFVNRKLQKWIADNKQCQMNHWDSNAEFTYPTIAFNLVFSLIHIYRHVFEEGIGLRQLTDYYHILSHSTAEERESAYKTLQALGLKKFVATVMYVMRRVFDMDEALLLCHPNSKEGEYLLDEILRGGNFGKFDERNKHLSAEKRFMRGVYNIKRNLRYLMHYPNEVVWIPVWKLWHWGWRKWKGYL